MPFAIPEPSSTYSFDVRSSITQFGGVVDGLFSLARDYTALLCSMHDIVSGITYLSS